VIGSFFRCAEESDSSASVGEFSRLEDPLAEVALEILDHFLPVEASEMVSLWQFLVWVDLYLLVVLHHVLVEELFVGDLPVVGKVVVEDEVF
jgi:hypothetical protein